jgi:uncharacterized protein (TIGR02302 family)
MTEAGTDRQASERHRRDRAGRPDRGDRGDRGEPRGFLALAWAAEAAERAWHALWPAAGVVGLFLALGLIGALDALGGWVHAALLAAFAAALAAALWRGARRLSLPDRDTARRRLERDSALAHRPLSGLLDRQAAGTVDRESRALWRLHKARLRAAAGELRVRLPASPAADDPMALRGLVALLLAVGVVAAGGDWADRLGRAVSPQIAGAAAAPPPALDLFVTPPDYTGLPPIYLQAQASPGGEAAGAGGTAGAEAGPDRLTLPAGSALAGRVTGGDGAPVLRLGELSRPFEPIAGSSYELETTIRRGHRLAVEQDGEVLGAWPMTVRPDAPPAAAFAEDPSATERWVLRLAYAVADDYGVEALTATVRLRDQPVGAMDREPIRLELSLPGRAPADAEGTAFFDLTAHTWAGLPVRIQLTARDAAGQTGSSEALGFVLPERDFSHPVAQAVIDQRRTLIRQPDYALEVAESLETLSLRPDRYREDLVVFLALRSAARRLRLAEGEGVDHVEPVQRLLWDTALRIEDGELSLAARDLREAQQALMEALESDASDEEIRRLMDELREAMDRYLAAMQQQMLDQLARGGEIPQLPFDPEATVLDRDMLAEMLDRMQSLAETGARDAARQMLSELQRMTEGLQSGAMGPPPDAMNQAMELMEDLQALIEAQQRLLDRTFRESREGRQPGQQGQRQEGQQGEGQPGLQGQPGGPSGAETQAALRRGLGEIMRDADEMLGSIPQNLGRGERAMSRAEGALERGNPGAAVPSQTEALEALRQGMQDMADQIMQQMAERYGPGMGLMPMPGGAGRDPLGRPRGRTGFSTDDVEIPSEADTGRARRILDELRRRLNQRDRPSDERDYFERLLRQF